jgi:hypothetical protein
MVDHKHTPSAPSKQGGVKDTYATKNPSHSDEPTPKGPDEHSRASDPVPTHDPSIVQPLVRQTETLPTAANPLRDREAPVGLARHAETPEEVEKINIMEHSKIPPPGSRHFVAGQPVNEEEYDRTEGEANRLAEAGRAQRTEAEARMAANTPGDPDYHPADPDKRDTPAAQSPPKAHDNDHDKDKNEHARR